MEDHLERILEVFNMYESSERKIDFLLRQLEWFVRVNDAYEKQISKDKEKKEAVKKILMRMSKEFENENVGSVKEEIKNALELLEKKEEQKP